MTAHVNLHHNARAGACVCGHNSLAWPSANGLFVAADNVVVYQCPDSQFIYVIDGEAAQRLLQLATAFVVPQLYAKGDRYTAEFGRCVRWAFDNRLRQRQEGP